MVDQAQAAIGVATISSRSARDRLERWRSRQEIMIVAILCLGVGSLAGLIGLFAFPLSDHAMTLGLEAAGLLIGLLAMCSLAWNAWPKSRHNDAITAHIAGDLAIADKARLLAQMAASFSSPPSTPAATLLARLVEDVDRAAGLARGREARHRGEADLRGRRHERIVPRQTRTTLTTPDNRTLHAHIVDVSLSGAAIDGNFPGCSVGARIRIGSHSARVVRVLPRGLACEFAELLPPNALTTDIIL